MMIQTIINFLIIILGLLSFIRPILLLYTFLLLPVVIYIPKINYSFLILKLGSINIYPYDFLVAIMALHLIVFLFNSEKISIVLKTPLSKAIIILFAWHVFICFLSINQGFPLVSVLRDLAKKSIMFLVFFIPLVKDIENKLSPLLRFSVYLGITLLVFSLIRYNITHEFGETSSGTMRSVDAVAVVVFMYTICYVLFMSKFKYQQLSIFVSSIFAIGIILAGHRSGLLVFLIAVNLYILHHNKILTKKIAILSFFGSFSLLFFVLISFINFHPGESFVGDTIIRFMDTFDLENETTVGRISYWQYSLSVVSRSPLIGKGSLPIYWRYMDDLALSRLSNTLRTVALERSPHNFIAGILIWEGLLGLSVLFFLIISTMYSLRKQFFLDLSYRMFLASYIFIFFVYSFFNTTYDNPSGRVYFFSILGMLNSVVVHSNMQRSLKK